MAGRGNSVTAKIINAAVFILLEVAALSMLGHSGQIQSMWLARGFHGVNAKIWGSAEQLRHYFSLGKENDRLAQENFDLRTQLMRYGLEQEENLTGDVVGSYSYMLATIVRHSRGKQHNFYIIDKGAVAGVQVGDGVVTSNGAVGIVNAVSESYAQVMAFTNHETVISARLGREGSVGPMKWDGKSNSGAVLREIPCHIEVNPGDTVFTSGFSSIFPPDIPLGLAVSTAIINGATYDIKVDLFEDYSTVRYVTVVGNIDRDEIESLGKE